MMKKLLVVLLCFTGMAFGLSSQYLRPQVNTVGLVAHYKLWAGQTNNVNLGPELLANGDFADWTGNDPDNWTVTEAGDATSNIVEADADGTAPPAGGAGTGGHCKLISDGTSTQILQGGILTEGKLYFVTLDITNVGSGNIRVRLGGGSGFEFTVPSSTGTHTVIGIAGPDGAFVIKRNAACNITFTNAVVKEFLGEVFDYSLNGNDGTVAGLGIAPVYPGFSFNGSDDYIDIGDISSNANTISLWFKPTTAIDKDTTVETVIHIGSGATDLIAFGASTLNLTDEIITVFNAAGGRSGYTSASESISTAWHHLACVWDGSKYLIYLDAVQKQNATHTTPALLLADGVEIGRKNDGSEYFGGNIDDVMIFSTVKTAAEIKSIYEVTRSRYGV